jgi:serine phosphatase RsbU (regulator of sigma subunit)/PAS domain-containing protein
MMELSENDIARLASFPEQNPNPVIEISLEGKIIYSNPAAKNHFPDLTEKNIAHPLFSELRKQLDTHSRKELNNFKCELHVGEAIFEQKFFYIEGNNAIRVYSSDISERKAIEKQLANLALFPEHNPNPVIEVDLKTEKVTYCNSATKKYFPDMMDKHGDHPLFNTIKTRLKHGKDFQCEAQVEGKIFEQKIFFIPDTNLIRVYSHNITESKETEKNLARLASFPEQNPSPIIEIDVQKNITYINIACRSHFPDLETLTFGHPLLEPLNAHFTKLRSGEITNYSQELFLNDKYYMQRGSFLKDYGVIRIFNLDITQQKHAEEIIREKNKDITDSINYAKRIQAAILPSRELVKQHLPDNFILYRPKDIVAGDFYWMEFLDDIVFIAAADCTGHGVPGAMVSVVCSNALNRAVKEFGLRETGKILDKVTDLVIQTFEKSGVDLNDGMDISLLALDRGSKKIQWSGAHNTLWYFANKEFTELKADKQPIGNYFDRKGFTTHTIPYNKGDMFYLYTDGYADQFGGARGKKFTYKRFKEILCSISVSDMSTQEHALEKTFLDWKGDLDQIDDVTIIGLRI